MMEALPIKDEDETEEEVHWFVQMMLEADPEGPIIKPEHELAIFADTPIVGAGSSDQEVKAYLRPISGLRLTT